jgi:WD40 repeat protein
MATTGPAIRRTDPGPDRPQRPRGRGGDLAGRQLARHRQQRRDRPDLERRRHPLATLTGHTSTVRAVAISPDGSWLATGGDDKTIRIWKTDDGGSTSATAIRADGILWGCAWFPGGTTCASPGSEASTGSRSCRPPADHHLSCGDPVTVPSR